MNRTLLAVPSEAPGGLEAVPAGHFGHCDVYTLIDLEDGIVRSVTTLPNPPHAEGGCLEPVQRLAERGVQVLPAGGMGMRPLNAFREAGIDVFRAAGFASVDEAVRAFLAGGLTAFSPDFVCRGGCRH